MWYFAWILGVTAAAAIAVINVMWYEFQDGLVVAVPTYDLPDGSQVPDRVV